MQEQEYGKIVDGELQLASTEDGKVEGDGNKPVEYAEIPAFDECTNYIYQLAPTESGAEISVGVAIGVVVQDSVASDGMLPPGPTGAALQTGDSTARLEGADGVSAVVRGE